MINKNWTLYYAKSEKLDNSCLYTNELSLKSFKKIKGINFPCLFEDVLKNHHIEGDVYLYTNMWDYAKYEDTHQFYINHFKSNKKQKYIVFDGIDTISEIFVNGKLIGKTNNQFLPFVFQLDNLKDDNEILIHIIPNFTYGKSFDTSKILSALPYNYESLNIRKSGSSFGWDILPRTCLGGVFKKIHILDKLPLIENTYIKPNFNDDLSSITFDFDINLRTNINGKYSILGQCDDSSFKAEGEIKDNQIHEHFILKNPKLWNVRGYGLPNQYLIEIKITKGNKIITHKTFKYGFRKIELFRSSIVEDGGCFEFHINNKKVFLQGTNYVPTDALKHIDNKRGKKCLDLIIDSNCNCIRIWGGGTYESEEFYSLCDELGIFIWHDFMMGCATYPNDERFLNLISEEVESIIKMYRHHASICLWAGDNECDLAMGQWIANPQNPNKNLITRKTIPEVIKKEDITRPFLPSSPYIDEKAFMSKEQVSEDHLWGPRDYFKGEYYKNAYPYFASETGYHGLNSPKSLKKFIKNVWPINIKGTVPVFDKVGIKPNKEYLCHSTMPVCDYNGQYAYRIGLMDNQVKTLFNNTKFDNLKDYALASQISQAEAFKFFIEKMRKDYKRNGGIIWWNMLDGWPQISDAVVDYYFTKKLAYHYIKASQADTLIMMEEDNENINLYISSNKQEDVNYDYEIIDAYDNDEVLLKGKITSLANGSILFKTLKRDDKHHFYIIKYTDGVNFYINHFHSNIININFKKYVNVLSRFGLLKLEGF